MFVNQASVMNRLIVEDCVSCKINQKNVLQEIGKQDKDIIRFLQSHGVLIKTLRCSTCGQNSTLRYNPPFFRCQKIRLVEGEKVRCNFKQSIKKNTWLAKAHLTYLKLVKFLAAWCTIPHPRHKLLVETLHVSEATVVDWSYFCRELCIWSLDLSDVDNVGGPGMIVEIDEAHLDKSKYHKESEVKGIWVFGAFDRKTKKCFFELVTDRTAETLSEIILNRIAPGTTIMLDQWQEYFPLEAHPLYQNLTVNHSINFVEPDSGTESKNIEKAWREVTSTPRYGSGKNKNAGYLAEFYWKRKYDVNDRVHNLLIEAARQFPPDAV